MGTVSLSSIQKIKKIIINSRDKKEKSCFMDGFLNNSVAVMSMCDYCWKCVFNFDMRFYI